MLFRSFNVFPSHDTEDEIFQRDEITVLEVKEHIPENTFAASNSSENTEIQNITEKTTTENTLKSYFDPFDCP